MAIERFSVEGYRSIRGIHLNLERVNVLVGPNGVGKTNLYRSMLLLAKAARGELSSALAEEGGMPSILWAGQRRKGVVRVRFEAHFGDYHYHLALGLPEPTALFGLDPEVKEEKIVYRPARGPQVVLMERSSSKTAVRDEEGRWVSYPMVLSSNESILAQIKEPHRFPELSVVREELQDWRFYHTFRTDQESPLRRPRIGTLTPRLSEDGHDLAAALQTIRGYGGAPPANWKMGIGDKAALETALEQAFPGAVLETRQGETECQVSLQPKGVFRPLQASELSDGTLRYLCLLAALLSPRPAALVALNEPETSLHPDLFPPLADLVLEASQRSQIWLTTHSEKLADLICHRTGSNPVHLEMIEGETRAVGHGLLG